MSAYSPKQNKLLAALPAQDYARLLSDLELVPMPLGWVVHESGDAMAYVYFPVTSVVSRIYVMESGASAQFAVTGNEGFVGISLFLGGGTAPRQAVVQSAGYGYRLRTNVVKRELALGGHLQHLALSYTHSLITQVAQTAACNRHHVLEQQLCRWLLISLDRLPGNELNGTHELIANMLGVRRESVAASAHKLQADGLIRYTRGRITVLDRPRLEERVCECYAAGKKEYERLLPGSATVERVPRMSARARLQGCYA